MYHSYGKIRHSKVELDGYKFDSKKEADYYLILKGKLVDNKIRDLLVHPKYILQEKFIKNNKLYRPITYSADFAFYDSEVNHYRVIDVKGFKTDVFKLKQKMFEYKFPEYNLELMRELKGGWTNEEPKKKRKKGD